ncbi:MAG: heme-binding beta-barrel domain-containing protein [Pseudomonadales bacterium]
MSNDETAYGPLKTFIGVWTGTGIDTVPDESGRPVSTGFFQKLEFAAGPILTYGKQTVRALRYACEDLATDDAAHPSTFFPVYEENGYFVWVEEQRRVVLQVSNPRGLSALAVGSVDAEGVLRVSTEGASGERGILVSGYFAQFSDITGYEAELSLQEPGTLHYSNCTRLRLPDGKPFRQTDVSTLRRYSGMQ